MNRKKNILIAAVAVAVAVTAACTGVCRMHNRKIQPKETWKLSAAGIDIYNTSVVLIADRGLSALAPEDTYFAVEKAGREGFENVEIDACETLDGVWVVMHDKTVDRMTDGTGKIANQTYFELLNYTVDNGANIGDYRKVKISTLEQVIRLCSQYGIKPYINISQISADGFKKIAGILEKLDMVQHCAIKSSNKECLAVIKSLKPGIELWYSAGKLTKKNMEWLKENKGFGADFNADCRTNTDAKIKQLLKDEVRLLCRNVNDLETLKRLHSLGLNNFSTDCILPK